MKYLRAIRAGWGRIPLITRLIKDGAYLVSGLFGMCSTLRGGVNELNTQESGLSSLLVQCPSITPSHMWDISRSPSVHVFQGLSHFFGQLDSIYHSDFCKSLYRCSVLTKKTGLSSCIKYATPPRGRTGRQEQNCSRINQHTRIVDLHFRFESTGSGRRHRHIRNI